MAEPEPIGLKDENRREGQVISRTGDKQRCEQLLAATAEDLKGCVAELMEVMEEDGGTIEFRGHDHALFRGHEGMLRPRFGMDTVGPRLYEEVVWTRVLRRRWRPVWKWAYAPGRESLLRKLVRKLGLLSRWAQVRQTPGAEIRIRLPTGLRLDDWSKASWTGELTVAADGAVQLSSSGSFCLPATRDNLRVWIARCKAEVPTEAQAAQRARKEREEMAEKRAEMEKKAAEEQAEMEKKIAEEHAGIYQWRRSRRRAVDRSIEIIPRSGDRELALSRIKLKQARALLHDEITLKQRRDHRRPRFREIATIDDPTMIRWEDKPRQPRTYEEILRGLGDPDDDRTLWEVTYIVGCRWEYGDIAAVMTVNVDGVVEIDSGGARVTATVENLRAILDRATS